MAWQTEVVPMVRILINDISEPYQYSDERIISTNLVAAKYIQFDVDFDYEYIVDMNAQTITPDPTEVNDQLFIVLLSLKTACLIDQSALRTKAAMEGVRAVLGPASLAVNGSAAAWEMILVHGPCKLYTDMSEYKDVENASAIAAILGPFSGNKFDPEFQHNRSRNSDRNGFYY
jgi:hypothetical protein